MHRVIVLFTLLLAVRPALGLSLADDFDAGVDPFLWSVIVNGDNTVEAIGGRLVFTQGTTGEGSAVVLRHDLAGDLEITVDLELLSWPSDNKEVIQISINDATIEMASGAVQRTSKSEFGGEVYTTDWSPIGGGVTSAGGPAGSTGTLRLRRTGTVYCGDYFDGAQFVEIACQDAGSAPDARIAMSGFSIEASSAGVQYAFDNIVVEAPASSICGDGVVELAEECDDGNTTDGDGCTGECLVGVPEPSAPLATFVGALALLLWRRGVCIPGRAFQQGA